MITSDRFEQILPGLLDDLGRADASDLVADVLAATGAIRQRRSWRVLRWWVPQIQRPTAAGAIAGPRPSLGLIIRIAIAAGLLLAAAAGSAWVASQRPPVRPAPPLLGIPVRISDMHAPRRIPVVAPLQDGRVLIAGGETGVDLPVEIFEPRTNRFVQLGGTSVTGDGSAAVLPDGTVLLVMFDSNYVRPFTWLFDPVAVSLRSGPPMAVDHRADPSTATLLDGRVLISGGARTQDQTSPFSVEIAEAEVFDPASRTFHATGSMTTPRLGHSSTTLDDGRVLIVGGDRRADAEIFDPRTGNFALTGKPSSVQGRNRGFRLADGRVVIVQIYPRPGDQSSGESDGPGDVELYDARSGQFSALNPIPHTPSTATLLSDGRIFVTSDGLPGNERWAGTYDPATGSTVDLQAPRAWNEVPVLLRDGRVLLVGGESSLSGPGQPDVPWAEVYP